MNLPVTLLKYALVVLFILGLPHFATASTPPVNTSSDKTSAWWGNLQSENQRLAKYLQDTYSQVERQLGAGNPSVNKTFAELINSSVPGSFVTPYRSGKLFYNGILYTFGSTWQISSAEKKSGQLTEQFYFTAPERYIVSYGSSSVTVYRLSNPENIYISATIPSISVDAANVFASRPFQGMTYRFGGVFASVSSPEGVLLTDVFRSTDTSVPVNVFAQEVAIDPDYRSAVLSTAGQLYAKKAPLVGVTATTAVTTSLINGVQKQITGQNTTERSKNPLIGLGVILGLGLGLKMIITIISGKKKGARRSRRSFNSVGSDFSISPPTAAHNKSTHDRPRAFNSEGSDFSILTPSAAHNNATHDRPRACNSESLNFSIYSPSAVCNKVTHERPTQWDLSVLQMIEWKRFEAVCEEYFTLLGYKAESTNIGADGGVDIRVNKDGRNMIVQCKAWNKQVDVKVVRELFGVMASENIERGFIFITGHFSGPAHEFATGKGLFLVSGESFTKLIKNMPPTNQRRLLDVALEGDYTTPTCCRCDVKMVKRDTPTSMFWGGVRCSHIAEAKYIFLAPDD